VHEIQVKSHIYNATPPQSDPPDILPYIGDWYQETGALEFDLANLPGVDVYDTIEVTLWTEHFAGNDPQGTPLGIDTPGSLRTFQRSAGSLVSIPLQPVHSFDETSGPLWVPVLESWGRIRLLKTDAGKIVTSSRDYLFDLGMPQVSHVVDQYTTGDPNLLWGSVIRYSSDRSFGCRFTPGNGRRIWTAVNIPHGIPPVAPGGTMPDA